MEGGIPLQRRVPNITVPRHGLAGPGDNWTGRDGRSTPREMQLGARAFSENIFRQSLRPESKKPEARGGGSQFARRDCSCSLCSYSRARIDEGSRSQATLSLPLVVSGAGCACCDVRCCVHATWLVLGTDCCPSVGRIFCARRYGMCATGAECMTPTTPRCPTKDACPRAALLPPASAPPAGSLPNCEPAFHATC